jgi:RimJ/RimL family protein N-acetyltransferase
MTISLQPLRREHLIAIRSWVHSYEQMVQWSGPWNFDFPLDEHQLAAYFLTESLDNGLRRQQFVVVEPGSMRPVGQIGFSRIWTKTNAAHVGPVIVDPALRGRGIGQQATRELLKIGFEDLKLHRIELVVFDFNKPAIACYEKAGFRVEGVLREIVRVGGEYWNWTAMSILEPEFVGTPVQAPTK